MKKGEKKGDKTERK